MAFDRDAFEGWELQPFEKAEIVGKIDRCAFQLKFFYEGKSEDGDFIHSRLEADAAQPWVRDSQYTEGLLHLRLAILPRVGEARS